jgi:hypothetical protein
MPSNGALVPGCGTHSPRGVAAFWACSPAVPSRGSPRAQGGNPTREPLLKFRASLMCAPDARVERPVSFNAFQRRSKTSVATNRSATAVNAAISAVVRSSIDLAVARWEPGGKPIFDARLSLQLRCTVQLALAARSSAHNFSAPARLSVPTWTRAQPMLPRASPWCKTRGSRPPRMDAYLS